jgi:hypothetical protein
MRPPNAHRTTPRREVMKYRTPCRTRIGDGDVPFDAERQARL